MPGVQDKNTELKHRIKTQDKNTGLPLASCLQQCNNSAKVIMNLCLLLKFAFQPAANLFICLECCGGKGGRISRQAI